VASEADRATLACLGTRSSRPRSCPWALSAEAERRILDARQRTNYGPARLAGLVGRSRGTIYKVLARHGCSQRRRSRPRQTYRRYEWAQPGALLHIDAKTLPKFGRPGHWAHGDRSDRNRNAGELVVISVVDDHSRLAYSELHGAETGLACAATLRRAAAWMREQGAGPVEAVMTDNAKAYTSHAFQDLLRQLAARHIPTPPYTPRWNGMEFPRFRGHLTGGPSGLLERMSVDAKDAAVFEGVPRRSGPLVAVQRTTDPAASA
jgi:transposase InsO family protein